MIKFELTTEQNMNMINFRFNPKNQKIIVRLIS